ncbi:MAG: hypothetical protein JOS17DRAFT_791109 [Linnemannia elongata]|nr:MAG: hypothetical protein JOS17DRAFT_791109 [Linnemannia elongata]
MTPKVTIPQTAIRIKNTQTGRLLYDNPKDGLLSWQESTNPDGYWYLTPVADNTYKIKNRLSGNCVYYNTGVKKPISWQDSINEDGKWQIVAVTDNTFKLRNVQSPKMFLYDNPTSGIIGYEDNNATDGIWTILH